MWEQPQRWLADQHFRRQVELVPTTVIDDIELVATSDISDFFVRLSDRAGARVTPRTSNSGLGVAWPKLLDDKSAAKIVDLYEQDFALTGTEVGDFSIGRRSFLMVRPCNCCSWRRRERPNRPAQSGIPVCVVVRAPRSTTSGQVCPLPEAQNGQVQDADPVTVICNYETRRRTN